MKIVIFLHAGPRSQFPSSIIPDGQRRKVSIQLLQLQEKDEGAVRGSHRHGDNREDRLGKTILG